MIDDHHLMEMWDTSTWLRSMYEDDITNLAPDLLNLLLTKWEISTKNKTKKNVCCLRIWSINCHHVLCICMICSTNSDSWACSFLLTPHVCMMFIERVCISLWVVMALSCEILLCLWGSYPLCNDLNSFCEVWRVARGVFAQEWWH